MSESSLQDAPTYDEEQFLVLVMRSLDGLASAEEEKSLTDQLQSDAVRRQWFVTLCRQLGMLREVFSMDARRGAGDEGRGVAGSAAIEEGSGLRAQGSGDLGFGVWDSENANPRSQIPNQQISVPESPASPIILDLSNPLSSPLTTSHYPLTTNFVGGPVFSYMVATVIVGMMLLGAWAYKITHYRQIVDNRAPSINRPEMQFVGRITGMVDCRWSDPNTETINGASVPLGRRYALASGLMEITYKSGAKVILEGPCTYKVESPSGGYLAVGKLTAKVESGEWKVESVKPQAANLQISKSPNLQIPSSFILHPSSFVVKTPTAIVTDLGTEFGVEVDKSGATTSHVFRGSVKVMVVGVEGDQKGIVLRENESARVEKGKEAGDVRMVLPSEIGAPPQFVRRLVELPKVLDLLDIVAGGDGTGHRRERGIDPTTGLGDPAFVPEHRDGSRQFRPIGWHRMIDGVFVPDGRAGSVQLDSAGHKFAGFPETSGKVYGSIWSRAAEIRPEDCAKDALHWIYAMGSGRQFMPEGRGLLCMSANAGIAFNLESMRKSYSGIRPARFRAVAGLADAHRFEPRDFGLADLWVFVDGRLKFKRTHFRPPDGVFPVDVALGPGDRCLTIVGSDGGNGYFCDWIVLGDPVLEMAHNDEEREHGSVK